MSEKNRPPLPIERPERLPDPALDDALLHAFHVAERRLLSELLEIIRDDELAKDREPYAYRQMLIDYLEETRFQAAACSEGVTCSRRPLLDEFHAGHERLLRRKVRLKQKRASSDGGAREP